MATADPLFGFGGEAGRDPARKNRYGAHFAGARMPEPGPEPGACVLRPAPHYR